MKKGLCKYLHLREPDLVGIQGLVWSGQRRCVRCYSSKLKIWKPPHVGFMSRHLLPSVMCCGLSCGCWINEGKWMNSVDIFRWPCYLALIFHPELWEKSWLVRLFISPGDFLDGCRTRFQLGAGSPPPPECSCGSFFPDDDDGSPPLHSNSWTSVQKNSRFLSSDHVLGFLDQAVFVSGGFKEEILCVNNFSVYFCFWPGCCCWLYLFKLWWPKAKITKHEDDGPLLQLRVSTHTKPGEGLDF